MYTCSLCDEDVPQLHSGDGYFRICFDCMRALEKQREEDETLDKRKSR